MPFYIRKSVSAGPFRFNFSKSGIGVSVGVRGLRFGTGPRGHYIHAGAGGLYYRSSIGQAGSRNSRFASASTAPLKEEFNHSDVALTEIESGDVMAMRDESFNQLLEEINAKNSQVRLSASLGWSAVVIGLLAGLTSGGPGILLMLLALPGIAIGRWLDSYRRSAVLFYDLETDAMDAYKRLTEGFDGLLGCAGKWHIEAGGAVTNLTAWKRHAGASHLVKKNATALAYQLPTVIKSNVTPPSLVVGKQTLFFMPDIILVQHGSRFGAVPYGELSLRWQDSRFIEDGRVPSDTKVVGYTWKHPNKSGGPDRRFRDNRQIPICLYEAIHFQSNSGINELVEVSQTGKAAVFAGGCDLLARLPKIRTTSLNLPAPSIESADSSRIARDNVAGKGAYEVLPILIVVAISLGILGLLIHSFTVGSDTTTPTENQNSLSTNSPPAYTNAEVPNLQRVAPSPTANNKSPSNPSESVENAAVVPSSELAVKSPAASGGKNQDVVPKGRVELLFSNTLRTQAAVNLRDGASKASKVIVTVPKGASVSVLDQDGDWSRVKTADGKVGWMASRFLQ